MMTGLGAPTFRMRGTEVTSVSDILKQCYEMEKLMLSPYACRSDMTRGREKAITPCELRTEFQRDRDRIIHCQSFRRLMYKTQVFLAPAGDHYRTRLTHTFEVTQIARTIARALRLNEDLTEAISLGHDLGHTPFGHAGEEAMRACFSPDFSHYGQSLRVVERLEKNGAGLNLTWEVRDGIVNHTGKSMAATLEGLIVKYADRIAYINHDIDDACRAGIMTLTDIPKELREVLGETHSARINRMVCSLVEASRDRNTIAMEDDVQEASNALRSFLFEHVYLNPLAKGQENKSKELLMRLFEYYVKHPDEMPMQYRNNVERDGIDRCVCDFISGMTDRYAIEMHETLFVPKVWRGIS